MIFFPLFFFPLFECLLTCVFFGLPQNDLLYIYEQRIYHSIYSIKLSFVFVFFEEIKPEFWLASNSRGSSRVFNSPCVQISCYFILKVFSFTYFQFRDGKCFAQRVTRGCSWQLLCTFYCDDMLELKRVLFFLIFLHFITTSFDSDF